MMNKNYKIFVTGHKGMLGTALVKELKEQGYNNLLLRTKKELDLRNQQKVDEFFQKETPDIVILTAAKVGGINANIKYPADFITDNIQIQTNVITSSQKYKVKKFIFIGSSCIYPRECPQPMKEEYLLTGKLEPTNEAYAIAKIAGIKMLEAYHKQYSFDSISLMPCNLYGDNDSFDLEHAHVLSSLVKRFSDAVQNNQKEITLWGTGIARREFMYVSDMAEAIIFFMESSITNKLINIGWGTDISIKELAELIAKKTGFRGKINWDSTKPDGMLRKCMDVSKMKSFGFSPKIELEEGIDKIIHFYNHIKNQI